MKLAYLAAFRAVMVSGTVSAAAEVLGRSQPAVSRLLDQLEEELGVQLFERRRGLISPTPIATQLLDAVDQTYLSLDTLRSLAKRASEKKDSRVSTAIMPALGLGFVPKVLERFRVDWPSTRVDLAVQLSASVEDLASRQQIDIGIAEMPLRRSGFRTEPFSATPYLAAIPRNHTLASKKTIRPRDLLGVPFVARTPFTPAGHLVMEAFLSSGVPLDPAYETTLSSTAYELAKRGLAVALVDPYTALEQLDDRVVLARFMPTIPFNVALLLPHSREDHPATSALIKAMQVERDLLMARLP
jgi:DNA-binding transcriptional LysR family regulator